MSQTRWTGPITDGSSPASLAEPAIEADEAQAVIEAYTAAVKSFQRSRAFEAALWAYLKRHPGVPESIARRRVAEVLCFASAEPAG